MHYVSNLLVFVFGIWKGNKSTWASFNEALRRAGLLDELSLVIVPNVQDNPGGPAVFDIPSGPGGLAAMGIVLEHCQVLEDGCIWLRYRSAWTLEARPLRRTLSQHVTR